jgi:protein O-GlcNAc transferase
MMTKDKGFFLSGLAAIRNFFWKRSRASEEIVGASPTESWEQARERLEEMRRRDPNNASNLSDLGQTLRLLGRLAEAEQVLRDAARADPRDPAICNRLATVLSQRGRIAEAEHYYKEVLRLSPGNVDALNNLGSLMSDQGKWAESEQWFRAAVAADPRHAMAQCNLGLALADRGMQAEAEQHFLAAVNADPNYYYARIIYVINKLRIIFDNESEIERCRAEYQKALRELRDWLPLGDAAMVRAACETVGWVHPFYLAYQGRNDRELQAEYGGFLCEIMARHYPQFAQPLQMPPVREGIALRIGIVSAFFCDHSNWKTPIRGWIENIDRGRFQVFGYHVGSTSDSNTQTARRVCGQFVEGLPFEALARKIREDALHVLIFPGIGLDPVAIKLATLRLAPIQCNSWGHPITSGMPSIDYFLSSELMEPDEGQDHYAEQLVRLPNISIHYLPPDNVVPPLARKDFGLPEDAVLYCCAQSLFKYLPQFDFIFPRIAQQVPRARFVFFSAQRSAALTEMFVQRIARAFERAGLEASSHIVVMPRMDNGQFQAAARLCDVYLDSVEWSGCNTTLEALAQHLPVITFCGSTMRARHTYAFLKMMGLDELIAHDLDSYVQLAIRIGKDASMRERVRAEIPRRLPRLYGDMTSVRALEEFVQKAVAAYPGRVPVSPMVGRVGVEPTTKGL